MNTGRRLGITVAAAVLALGAAACGTAPATAAAPGAMMGGTAPQTTGDVDDRYGAPGDMMGGRTAAPSVPHSGAIAGEGLDPAVVATLQGAVDQGAQPWRLEPRTTAGAFVRARFGWMMPRTLLTSPGTVVVDDGTGGEASLTLAQPARAGSTGIWAVTGGTWLR